MAWLTRREQVLATLAPSGWSSWRRAPEGALLLDPPAVVHTLRGVALDVAWCVPLPGVSPTAPGMPADRLFEVRRTASVPAGRVARPCLARGVLLVAARGSFERWELRGGDRVAVTR